MLMPSPPSALASKVWIPAQAGMDGEHNLNFLNLYVLMTWAVAVNAAGSQLKKPGQDGQEYRKWISFSALLSSSRHRGPPRKDRLRKGLPRKDRPHRGLPHRDRLVVLEHLGC